MALPPAACAKKGSGPVDVAQRAKSVRELKDPDPQKDLKIRSLEPYEKLYGDYIEVIMGLYGGSNF